MVNAQEAPRRHGSSQGCDTCETDSHIAELAKYYRAFRLAIRLLFSKIPNTSHFHTFAVRNKGRRILTVSSSSPKAKACLIGFGKERSVETALL